jgi:hypothetical protein
MALQDGNRLGQRPGPAGPGRVCGRGALAHVLVLAVLSGGCASQAPVVHPGAGDWFREAQTVAVPSVEGSGLVADWFGEHPILGEAVEAIGMAARALLVMMAVGVAVAAAGAAISGG